VMLMSALMWLLQAVDATDHSICMTASGWLVMLWVVVCLCQHVVVLPACSASADWLMRMQKALAY